MVERVGRAICASSVVSIGCSGDMVRAAARAAIAAMRKPTEAMWEAVEDRNLSQEELWRAMIDAALQPAPGTVNAHGRRGQEPPAVSRGVVPKR